MVVYISKLHKEVRKQLEFANQKYKAHAYKRRTFKAFRKGDLVMVHLMISCGHLQQTQNKEIKSFSYIKKKLMITHI